MEHLLLVGKYVIAVAIPDVPEHVDIQLQRQEYIVSKVNPIYLSFSSLLPS